MNEERDSQLSAMFDGELPATECELLSRRLGRDEVLRARWSRYAAIGAVLRSDPTVVVHGNLARRVSAAVAAESAAPARHRQRALWQMFAGTGVAAAVAGLAIVLLRTGVARQDVQLTAFTPTVQRLESSQPVARPLIAVNAPTRTTIEAPSYVVPPAGPASEMAPIPTSAAFANYVVAHSEYSSPLSRPHLLSALIASDLAQPDPQGPLTTAAGASGNASR